MSQCSTTSIQFIGKTNQIYSFTFFFTIMAEKNFTALHRSTKKLRRYYIKNDVILILLLHIAVYYKLPYFRQLPNAHVRTVQVACIQH